MNTPLTPQFSFDLLVNAISHVHTEMAAEANRAVNASLTLRNWAIGFYIEEYERKGADRAAYGDKLMDVLATSLTARGISRCDRREIYRYRQLYLTYPQIVETVSPQLLRLEETNVLATALAQKTLIHEQNIVESLSPQLGRPQKLISGRELVSKLSFSHLAELLQCEDATKRNFYEVECLRGNWSVRELKRQIASLYFERSGLSFDKKRLSNETQISTEQSASALAIRDPYVFEFLGLKPQEVMHESNLEAAILQNLEGFLLELGHGFCFEARQKRILIGESLYFVDLVFYHRVLKCHVLIELKLAEFNHENIGQLNTYVSWYRKHMMSEGDNPPIGILLCTKKDHALVEYALSAVDNDIFVSKYLLELPKKEDMQRFIEAQLNDHPITNNS
jgi:predicted nuclease of restriction endonuclease-like (RecB) superfamily